MYMSTGFVIENLEQIITKSRVFCALFCSPLDDLIKLINLWRRHDHCGSTVLSTFRARANMNLVPQCSFLKAAIPFHTDLCLYPNAGATWHISDCCMKSLLARRICSCSRSVCSFYMGWTFNVSGPCFIKECGLWNIIHCYCKHTYLHNKLNRCCCYSFVFHCFYISSCIF